MSNVKFVDNTAQVESAINNSARAFLVEIGGELASRAADNTRVDTGQLKGSWDYEVDGDTVTIGSPLEYAIWQELGTGEYAAMGNGRKGGWRYKDGNGKWHFTRGNRPTHALENAFNALKPAIVARAKEVFDANMK